MYKYKYDVICMPLLLRIKLRHSDFASKVPLQVRRIMGCFGSSNNIMSWLIILMAAVVWSRVHGQSLQGFISIDCGLGNNNSYTDEVTQIQYTSDGQYTETGVDHMISGVYLSSSPDARTSNLRSFPNGSRNCYTLSPVTKSSKYLVRASFYYGNYDGLQSANTVKPLMFDLHVDADYWWTVKVLYADRLGSAEVITVAKRNYISICLVNIGTGTPFISALELRPLRDDMYLYANTTQSLNLLYRDNLGGPDVRYPDDPFDRIWWSWTYEAWTTLSTNATSINRYSDDQFLAPLAVMKTAAVPINSTILSFYWNYADTSAKNNQFYVNLHFMELLPNTTRAFNTYVNDFEWNQNYTPSYLWADYLSSISPMYAMDMYQFALNSSGLSTLPPILNALELFSPVYVVEMATDSGDVDAITNIKMQYQVKKNWMGDPCGPEQYIWDGIKCNYASGLSRIIAVNLSSSGLNGFISSYFTKLTTLQYLDLSINNLTGPIPEALGNLESLKVLNISCNNFTGTIPPSLLERSQQGLKVFNDSNSCLGPFPPIPPSKDTKNAIIVSVSVVAAVLLFIVVFLVWRTKRLQGSVSIKQNYPRNSNNATSKSSNNPFQLEGRQFTYMQLTQITSNFASVIGRGGFGIVYLGYLENGEQVAIKMCARPSRQETKEFLAEAQNLTRIHHRNLVSLIGYCMDGDNLALVYEYMSQGSLHEYLRAGKPGIISWRERLRIAVDAAQGLEYLHKGCNPPIVHRDIKTNNILLGSAFEAKISDFGLSKAFMSNFQTHVSTMSVAGTPGYVDPEYHSTLQLTEKSDVYSFGVVLLELVTGLPPIMPNSGIGHIVQRVSSSLARGDLRDIVDGRLRGKYDTNSIWKVLDLAIRCTAQKGNQRPTMSYVVSQLKDSLELVIAGEKNDNSNSTRESDTSQSTAFEIGMSIPESFSPSAR